MVSVELLPVAIEGEIGLDVCVLSSRATVADLSAALQAATDDPHVLKPFHKQRYSVCRGCVNNCCKYNAIWVDLVAAERLAARQGLSLRRWASRYLANDPDLPYPEFRRRPCPFLKDNCCTVYAERPLICRLYLCTPMTDRLEKLRCAVLLAGEAALRQRLVELGYAPRTWTERYLGQQLQQRWQAGELTPAAWHQEQEQLDLLIANNPFFSGRDYQTVRLQECCTPQLWQTLWTKGSDRQEAFGWRQSESGH